jgi:hypothetical protein
VEPTDNATQDSRDAVRAAFDAFTKRYMEQHQRFHEQYGHEGMEYSRYPEPVTPEYNAAFDALVAENREDTDRLEAELRSLPSDVPGHIVALLDEMDMYPRRIGCLMLVRLKDRSVVPALISRLVRPETPPFPSEHPKASLLGRLYQRFVDKVVLGEMQAEIRDAQRFMDKKWAAYALSRLGDKSALPAMERFLSDRDERLRTCVKEAIDYLRGTGEANDDAGGGALPASPG